MTIFVFPGQGSQKKGMGEGMFEKYPELTQKADAILGYSIQELCLNDPLEQLGQTQYTQPALYVVNALHAAQKRTENGVPAYVAGHSLGEYNALLEAQVFDFETGLKLVQKRGRLMQQATGGGMAAIIGLTTDQIKAVIAESEWTQIEIANYNSPLQTVISGEKTQIESSLAVFKAAGARLVVPLNVSGAFHSSRMKSAQEEFAQFLTQFEFQTPQIPVFSNVTAELYPDAASVPSLLAQQITSSVRWTEIITTLLDLGQETFEEAGPGQVLSGLLKAIRKDRA
jgi:malonyl CoA-acyl carrier protein transacylase